MKQEKLKELIKDQAKKVNELYLSLAPYFDPETIHDFRTSAKKLRALLRLITKTPGQPKLSLPFRFKHSYHIAGKMRDKQILQEKIIKDLHAPTPVFFDFLTHSLFQSMNAWEIHFQPGRIKKWMKQLDLLNLNDLSTDDLRAAFLKNIRKINLLIADPTDENLHAARMKIKDMFYNSKLVQKEWHNGYETLQDLQIERLEALAALLGDYHDHFMIHKTLTDFNSPAKEETEKNCFRDLIQKEWATMLVQKERILSDLNSYTKKIT